TSNCDATPLPEARSWKFRNEHNQLARDVHTLAGTSQQVAPQTELSPLHNARRGEAVRHRAGCLHPLRGDKRKHALASTRGGAAEMLPNLAPSDVASRRSDQWKCSRLTRREVPRLLGRRSPHCAVSPPRATRQ